MRRVFQERRDNKCRKMKMKGSKMNKSLSKRITTLKRELIMEQERTMDRKGKVAMDPIDFLIQY